MKVMNSDAITAYNFHMEHKTVLPFFGLAQPKRRVPMAVASTGLVLIRELATLHTGETTHRHPSTAIHRPGAPRTHPRHQEMIGLWWNANNVGGRGQGLSTIEKRVGAIELVVTTPPQDLLLLTRDRVFILGHL
jgi:hypothetical protein